MAEDKATLTKRTMFIDKARGQVSAHYLLGIRGQVPGKVIWRCSPACSIHRASRSSSLRGIGINPLLYRPVGLGEKAGTRRQGAVLRQTVEPLHLLKKPVKGESFSDPERLHDGNAGAVG